MLKPLPVTVTVKELEPFVDSVGIVDVSPPSAPAEGMIPLVVNVYCL